MESRILIQGSNQPDWLKTWIDTDAEDCYMDFNGESKEVRKLTIACGQHTLYYDSEYNEVVPDEEMIPIGCDEGSF